MATDLQTALQNLAARSSTERPFLSVYLDWTPDGTGKRQARVVLEQELRSIADRVAGQDAARASFEADRQRILDYVDSDAPKEAAGLAIFACHAEGVWEALPLPVQVETQVVADRYPHLFSLARIIDDYETYAVVLADSQESRIFVIALNGAEIVGKTEAAEEIKRFDVGGTAQMQFQRRTENLIKAHTKDIAEVLGRIIQRHYVQHIVIAGNDSIKGIVMGSLPEQIKAKLADYVHLDVTSNIPAIIAMLEPIMREVERQQEADIIADLEGQMASRGGLGVAGVASTALALSKGQVRTLLVLQGFSGSGGECPNCAMLQPGQRTTCPYDGADLQPVDLREAFVARALQQSADVQIVADSAYLDQHQGVGALLRYRDDEQARGA